MFICHYVCSKKAGVKEAEFMNYQTYDEDILGKIVEAATEVLGKMDKKLSDHSKIDI